MDKLPSEASNKAAKKGIIKKTETSDSAPQSSRKQNAPRTTSKAAHFDEENIKETYRPMGKNYGFDTIAEPKTPYERDKDPVDANVLKDRLMDIAPRTDGGESELEKQRTRARLESSAGTRRGSVLSEASDASGASGASKMTIISAAISNTSNSMLSFEEKRKKHIQAEFRIAKDASVNEVEGQERCTNRK